MAVETSETVTLPPQVELVYAQIDAVKVKVGQVASRAEEFTRPYESLLEEINILSERELEKALHEPFEARKRGSLGQALARQRPIF